MCDTMYKRWFLSQVGKAIDCNSMIAGSSPTGTSKNKYFKKNKKKYWKIICHLVLYLGICERNVAQLGSASGLGPEGYGFKSCHPDHYGGLTQLVECLLCKQKVTGSSPVSSTKNWIWNLDSVDCRYFFYFGCKYKLCSAFAFLPMNL